MPVRDVRGRTFQTLVPPRRIVSLVPSLTETLFAFGAGERVVGVTDYCIHPSREVAARARVGGTKNPSVGDILALAPDLVIANVEENRKPDIEALEENGVPVFCTFARTVRGAIEELQDLARLVGADKAHGQIEAIERARAAIKPRKIRPRVFVAIWRDPWMTANGETFIGDLVETCGGENVFAGRQRRFPLAADLGEAPEKGIPGADTRYPRLALQEIASREPQVILLPDEPYRFTERDRQELQAVPGLGSARVELIDGTLVSWYGVRMRRALETLPRILNPDEPPSGCSVNRGERDGE